MSAPPKTDLFAPQRRYMVERDLRARGVSDARVLDAMLHVPRHEFVPTQYRDQAYQDHPLPIGEDQTISQPYIVALMLEALQLSPTDKVLEVGTGSGYVTALLAELTAQVISVERLSTLAEKARQALSDLSYGNVEVIVGDGYQGFQQGAPYDAIIVSAAALNFPHVLLSQLSDDGGMIIPIGPPNGQKLHLVRMEAGRPIITSREPCRFVPLISEASSS